MLHSCVANVLLASLSTLYDGPCDITNHGDTCNNDEDDGDDNYDDDSQQKILFHHLVKLTPLCICTTGQARFI